MGKQVAEKKQGTEIKESVDISKLEGFEEGVDMSEITLPRVKLVQGLSKEATDENLDIRQGWLINHITKEKYETPLKFIPLTKATSYIRYNARKPEDYGFDPAYEPAALIYIHSNKADVPGQDSVWLNGKPPLARKYISFLSYLPDYPEFPVVVSMGKTSCKVAENMVNTLFMKQRPMYESMFELSVQTKEKDGNKFYAYQSKLMGNTPEEYIPQAKSFYNSFAQSMRKHAEEDIVDPIAADAASWTE